MTVLRVAEAVVRTDTGRQRRGNEDSSFARAPLFVVADGMGGAQAGEVASQLAVDVFGEGLPADGIRRGAPRRARAGGQPPDPSSSRAARPSTPGWARR